MELLNYYLEVAIQSAIEAGAYLLNRFGEDHSPIYKSEFDIGLLVDKDSEKIILQKIIDEFPSHNIYSEEIGGIKNKSDFTWYIDPLDGTNNYYAGIPYFGVSIALVKNSEPIVGVVYNPITDQLFTAIKGGGAFLNYKMIRQQVENKIPYAVLSFIRGHHKNGTIASNIQAKELEDILSDKFMRVLKMWAPSLDWCLLALGKIDVLVSYESELEDMLAGLLIAQESGFKVYNFSGSRYRPGNDRIIVSKKELINDLIQLLNPFSM